MTYRIRRFSYPEALSEGREYISSAVDSGLGGVESLTGDILEDPRFKDLRPVKKHVRLVNSISKLLRRKKKKEKREFTDPTTTLNTSEANKFKVSLNRLTSAMGNDTQGLIN